MCETDVSLSVQDISCFYLNVYVFLFDFRVPLQQLAETFHLLSTEIDFYFVC